MEAGGVDIPAGLPVLLLASAARTAEAMQRAATERRRSPPGTAPIRRRCSPARWAARRR